MEDLFEKTTPRPSRWDQDGAEYVRSHLEWCARFQRHLTACCPDTLSDEAMVVAQEVCLDDEMRALSPEAAVDELLALDLRTV